MLDRLVGSEADEDGVDLHELAGHGRFEARGQAFGVALADHAEAAAAGLATQGRDRHDQAPLHQAFEDAADGGCRDRNAFAVHQPGEFSLAPHGIVAAQFLDRQRRAPLRPAKAPRPPREGFGALGPAVERGARDANRFGRFVGRQARGACFLPSPNHFGAHRGFVQPTISPRSVT